MRKLQHLLYMLLVGMAITAFTACSDDDDYQPAQKVAEDNMGAYFAAANAASEVLTPEEYAARPKVDLKVKRQNTKGDVSIPVVVDKADAVFKVPAAVEFKDGESEATLSVACPGLQALQSYQFSIHLDEAATNPYVKVDGSPVFSYTVMVARWVKVVENATFMYQSNIFPSVKSVGGSEQVLHRELSGFWHQPGLLYYSAGCQRHMDRFGILCFRQKHLEGYLHASRPLYERP